MIEFDDATPEVQAIYQEVMDTFQMDDVPNMFKCIGDNISILKTFWEEAKSSWMRNEVPAPVKQVMLFAISFFGGNKYCALGHADAAMKMDSSLQCADLVSILRTVCDPNGTQKLPEKFMKAIELSLKINFYNDYDVEEARKELIRVLSAGEYREALAVLHWGMRANQIIKTNVCPLEVDNVFDNQDIAQMEKIYNLFWSQAGKSRGGV